MSYYEVRDVVCDYGVFEDGELKLILNSRRIAVRIVELLIQDELMHKYALSKEEAENIITIYKKVVL